MSFLQIIYAPNEIFTQKAQPVEEVDDEVRDVLQMMFKTLEIENGIGLGANMVGFLNRMIVVDWFDGGERFAMVNPEITYKSEETQEFEEASLSFPGISAKITRPKKIKVKYLDEQGKEQSKEAEGFLATLIQHEIDYLDGVVFLDYLSKLKRERLLKKMDKHMKKYPPHIHGKHCNH